jgi:hypothetical protein
MKIYKKINILGARLILNSLLNFSAVAANPFCAYNVNLNILRIMIPLKIMILKKYKNMQSFL